MSRLAVFCSLALRRSSQPLAVLPVAAPCVANTALRNACQAKGQSHMPSLSRCINDYQTCRYYSVSPRGKRTKRVGNASHTANSDGKDDATEETSSEEQRRETVEKVQQIFTNVRVLEFGDPDATELEPLGAIQWLKREWYLRQLYAVTEGEFDPDEFLEGAEMTFARVIEANHAEDEDTIKKLSAGFHPELQTLFLNRKHDEISFPGLSVSCKSFELEEILDSKITNVATRGEDTTKDLITEIDVEILAMMKASRDDTEELKVKGRHFLRLSSPLVSLKDFLQSGDSPQRKPLSWTVETWTSIYLNSE